MKKTTILIIFLIILIGILALVIYNRNKPEPVVEEPAAPAESNVIEPNRRPIVHYPVPEPVPTAPAETPETQPEEQLPLPATLPKVGDSDESVGNVFKMLIAGKSGLELLNLQNFIQRLVVTIDNLPEKQLPKFHLPISRPKGSYIVSGTADSPQTSSRNHRRYSNHVALLETIEPKLAIKAYVHFYPLFQAAYKDLGYPNAYFNDRLVYVIDHLLETPDQPEPIQLEQPLVQYTFSNLSLEKRSAGQKILLRIGPENRARTLKVLKEYRSLLINLRP